MNLKDDGKIKIGIICSVEGRPTDILLPIISSDKVVENIDDIARNYFIYSMTYTKVLLFYISDKEKKLARVDIRSSCKLYNRLSLYIVKNNGNRYFLRAYTDEQLNALYPLPF